MLLFNSKIFIKKVFKKLYMYIGLYKIYKNIQLIRITRKNTNIFHALLKVITFEINAYRIKNISIYMTTHNFGNINK